MFVWNSQTKADCAGLSRIKARIGFVVLLFPLPVTRNMGDGREDLGEMALPQASSFLEASLFQSLIDHTFLQSLVYRRQLVAGRTVQPPYSGFDGD